MKIRIKTDATADPILREMATQAKLSVEDLAAVAVYNLISMWVGQKGVASHDDGNLVIANPPPQCVLPDR